MTQSPLFPDIVPEPDETRWDIFDDEGAYIMELMGRTKALSYAQAFADEHQRAYRVAVASEPEDSKAEWAERLEAAEIVRPFGLPW